MLFWRMVLRHTICHSAGDESAPGKSLQRKSSARASSRQTSSDRRQTSKRHKPALPDTPDQAQALLGQSNDEIVIPVIAESLKVGKRTKEQSRVVVHVVPEIQKRVVDIPLTDEHVEVHRVPIDRIVDEPAAARTEGDVTIIPIYEQVLVVQKKLRLKEEVRITRRKTTRQVRREVELRSERAEIRRVQVSGKD